MGRFHSTPGRRRFAAAAVAFCAALSSPSSQSALLGIDSQSYLAHVKFLASDELEGRGNGTPGLERAAEYIAGEFEKAGLEAGGDHGSYFQTFDITSRLEPDPRTALTISTGSGITAFKLGAQFHPLSVFERPEWDGARKERAPDALPIVFAGYGITAPSLGYDDYAGVDVNGKAVVVFTHEPQEADPRSVFEGSSLTLHSDIAQKAAQAKRHGARLLIIVEDPAHVTDRAMATGWMNDPQIDAHGIPVLRVERSRLARALDRLDFEDIAEDIDRDLMPRSRPLPSAAVRYVEAFARVRPRVRNVVGIVRGSDPRLATEAIVVGAHYDHLGLGGRFSRAPQSAAEIHNGADDNASGTAAVVEMARVAARSRQRFKRSVIFAAFAGEEIGLLGSKQYVARAPISVLRTKAMINLDMVGRAGGRVMVGGPERNRLLKELVEEIRPLAPLRLDDFRDGYEAGASDDASFLKEGVPVLAFFTGFHDDYHRPTDDWDRIDAEGAASIASIALAIVERLAGRN